MKKDKTKLALKIATVAHEGQTRKGSGEPYITHPIAVAELLRSQGLKGEVITAALLHDVLEDVPQEVYSEKDMQKDFGISTVELVKSLSEIKIDTNGNKIPWKQRKSSYIKQIRQAKREAVEISIADKTHNITSLINDIKTRGSKVWKDFNAGPEEQKWYYTELLDKVFLPRLGEKHSLVIKLRDLIKEFNELC